MFAVCTSCGCAWFEPQFETWKQGDLGNCLTNYHEYAPQGFVVASLNEIRDAGLESVIVDVRDYAKWVEEFRWFNHKYYGC